MQLINVSKLGNYLSLMNRDALSQKAFLLGVSWCFSNKKPYYDLINNLIRKKRLIQTRCIMYRVSNGLSIIINVHYHTVP